MKDVNEKNFGILIAFLLPGFIFLWGVAHSIPRISVWFEKGADPTVGGFLYLTLASIAVGLLISGVRWLVVDHFMRYVARIRPPKFDFGKLKDKDLFAAFNGLVENHYRYYQYYANTLVAVAAAWILHLATSDGNVPRVVSISVPLLCITLGLAAYDCLAKYNKRLEELVSR